MRNPRDVSDDELHRLLYAMLRTGQTPIEYERGTLKAEFERRFPFACERGQAGRRKGK
jgi:hypothetical protein